VGAFSETYVDPSIAANSGTGTIGDPYGDLQYALDTMTRDSTNGDRINIKAGTSEILAAGISLSSYGSPGAASPICWQGYTSTAGDGGRGGISLGGGTFSIKGTGMGFYQMWRDLEIHNAAPTAQVWKASTTEVMENVKFHDITGNAVSSSNGGVFVDCWFEDISGYGLDGNSPMAIGCYFKNGTKKFTTAYRASSARSFVAVTDCIFSLDGSSNGIYLANYVNCRGNTVFSNGGTGIGIDGNNLQNSMRCTNNYVEGFSGVGGYGFDAGSATFDTNMMKHNAAYGNATDYRLGDEHGTVDNETLTSSGLAKSGSDTYANRLTYFAPADEGNMLSGHMGWAKGAVPAAAGGAASMLRRSNFRGGY